MCFVCNLTNNDSLKSILHPKSLEDLIDFKSSKNFKTNNNENRSDLNREYGNFSPTSIIFDSSNTYEGFNDLSSFVYLDGLLAGSRWNNISSDSVTETTDLKYYLYDNQTVFYEDSSFQTVAISPEEINAINYSFESFSNVANITFTQTNSANEAHIAWQFYDNNEYLDDYAGVAYLPETGSEDAGYIAINSSIYSNQNLDSTREIIKNSIDRGSYAFITFPHELGHALGLKHPHDKEIVNINNQEYTYNTFPGVDDGGKDQGGDNGLNASPWTVMTYNDYTSGNEYSPTSDESFSGFLLGLGAFDIASVQYIYGPNKNYNQENNTYILDSNLNGYQCIWDTGGEDVIDASNASSSVNIDLRNATLQNESGGGGFVSRVKDSYKGFTIAYNSTGSCVIENAIGSTYNDNLIGNAYNNSITGGAGDDIIKGGIGNDNLSGGSGNDTLSGGNGNDNIDGGSGVDTILLDFDSDNYTISASSSPSFKTLSKSVSNSLKITHNDEGGNGIDYVLDIEKILFNDFEIDTASINYLNESDSLSYLASNLDLIDNFGLKTLVATNHYYNFGELEGRSLDTFDEWSYLASHEDLITAFGSDTTAATKHYVANGYAEGRIKDSFDEWGYLASNNDLMKTFGTNTTEAVKHYISYGMTEGRGTNGFNAESYLNNYADLNSNFGNDQDLAKRHYVEHGFSEGRTDSSSGGSSNLTDLEVLNYVASNNDLISAFGINIEAAKSHYINHGKTEERSLDTFDEWSYLASHGDLISAFGTSTFSATEHYLSNGYAEGRSLDTFDEWSYLASHEDLITAFGSDTTAATKHYVANGYAEGRSKDSFDEWGYLASNNDLMNAFGSDTREAVKHYISYGKLEGRLTNIFNAESYLNSYADLKSAFGNDQDLAKRHYVEHGFSEGRVF